MAGGATGAEAAFAEVLGDRQRVPVHARVACQRRHGGVVVYERIGGPPHDSLDPPAAPGNAMLVASFRSGAKSRDETHVEKRSAHAG